ncbi:sulfatase family protein [Rhizobium binxianense]
MPKRPNILLIFPDQVRPDWIEPVAGVPVRTPNVRRLAARGTLFARAWTPSPLCAPARACLACGTSYDRSPVKHNKDNVPETAETIYKRMARAGYAVSTTGKLDLLKGYMDWGSDGRHMHQGRSRLEDLGFTGGIDSAGKHDALFGRDRGAQEPYMGYLASLGLDTVHYEDYRRREPAEMVVTIGEALKGNPLAPPPAYANTDLSPLPEDAYPDNWIGRKGLEELRRLMAGEAPWFLTVNFAGPHEPLDVTRRMRDRWKDIVFPPPHGYPDNDDSALQQTIRQNYAAMIELIDDWLGAYVETLEAAGQIDDTLVVFASDHGEMLGDLNLWAKQLPHEASVGVPLVMAGPGCRPAPHPCKSPVSLLDMMMTFLDYGGIDGAGFEGVSLRPTLETGAAPERELVYAGLGNWRAVSDGRFKLVAGLREDIVSFRSQFTDWDASAIASAKLFDLDADPWESHDISTAEPAIRRRLMAAMANDCGVALPDTAGDAP